MTSTAPHGVRRRQLIFLAVGVVTALALAVAVVAWVSTLKAPVDMRGNRVSYDDQVPPRVAASASPTPDLGTRFVVPSVGLDVPLGALSAVDGDIEPPGFTAAYWVRNEGVSVAHGEHGTVFVVMHSLRNGGVGPGNYLIDVAHRRARVADGAAVEVGGVAYTVTGTAAVSKGALPHSSAVWADTPKRLVIITCLQKPGGGPSVQNMVITATRDG